MADQPLNYATLIIQCAKLNPTNNFQSMPKMPEGEKKEESAESLAEKKEQVLIIMRAQDRRKL